MKGKEYYDDGKLRFECEFLDNKNVVGTQYDKNGNIWKGKGYDKLNNVVFEINDGKGLIKEYNDFGRLLFEGEYLNGKRNGKGKEYDDKKLEFEGEYLNGKRNGKGKEYYNNGKLRFEGEYLYNYKLKGKYYLKEKLEYEGEFR